MAVQTRSLLAMGEIINFINTASRVFITGRIYLISQSCPPHVLMKVDVGNHIAMSPQCHCSLCDLSEYRRKDGGVGEGDAGSLMRRV